MLKVRMLFLRVLVFIIPLANIGCSGDKNILNTAPEVLVSYKKVGSINVNQMKDQVQSLLKSINTDYIQNDVDYYSIVYKSTYKGREVNLSGLVLMPHASNKVLTHYQYHHGTLYPFKDYDHTGSGANDAPSLYDKDELQSEDQYEVRLFGLSFASAGYFVSLPDYSGYGKSSDLEHAYLCSQILAEESSQMIRASRELAKILGVRLNSDIYLGGWSEGGAVCTATHKLIQNRYTDLNVVASLSLAGSHIPDIEISHLKNINEDEESVLVSLLAWGTYAHCKLYNKPVGQYLNPEITDIESLFIISQVPSLKNIYNESTREKRYTNLNELHKASTTYEGWIPRSPAYFFHGTADDLVSPEHSKISVERFLEAGASKENVSLTLFPGENHESVDFKYLVESLKICKITT
ncbi:MAG: lipase family protein [Mucinivorans sp.]